MIAQCAFNKPFWVSNVTPQPAAPRLYVLDESKKLAPNATPLSELVTNERNSLVKKSAQLEAETTFQQEHTFQPNADQPKAPAPARPYQVGGGGTTDYYAPFL